MFRILFSIDVEKDLKKLSPFYRNRILNQIEIQLSDRPNEIPKNKKVLINLSPPWTSLGIVRELRVGEYRVFYDVDGSKREVYIRAVRKKTARKTTEEIL